MSLETDGSGGRKIHALPHWEASRDTAAYEPLAFEDIDVVLRYAIDEDRGGGDLTSEVAVSPERRALGKLIAKDTGILSGIDVFGRVFELLDEHVKVMALAQDGAQFHPGDVLAKIDGTASSLLTGERTALNFVQRMSGIATLTRRYVAAAEGAHIYDTRKTTPGLRQFEKYAVRCGGARNHRFGLFDEVMVKNNHIDLAGTDTVGLLYAMRAHHGAEMRINAEARDEAEALDAIAGGADVVMLDNMTPDELGALCPVLRKAAEEAGRDIELEATGGITLENVARFAATGIDRISIGALTHSAPALDLSLSLEVLP